MSSKTIYIVLTVMFLLHGRFIDTKNHLRKFSIFDTLDIDDNDRVPRKQLKLIEDLKQAELSRLIKRRRSRIYEELLLSRVSGAFLKDFNDRF